MIANEKSYRLRPVNSPSDKDFKLKVGDEQWERIKSKTLRDEQFKCQGCGFEPYDTHPDSVLDVHVVSEKEENILESEFRTLCKLCHIIEHADAAIEHGFVTLVNSKFSQGELVNISRNNVLSEHIRLGDIRPLRKKMSDFLEELKDGRALEGEVKFIFTEKYLNKFN